HKDIGALGDWLRVQGLEGPESVPEATAATGPGMPATGLKELESLIDYTAKLGLGGFVQLDTSVVRGLAYYTGIVFEVYDKGMGMRAVAGGGRYDNLLASLGGNSLTGVGFGMGDVVLADLLRDKGLLPKGREPLDYYLVDVVPNETRLPDPGLLALAQRLRAGGRRVGYSLSGEK